MKKIILLIVLVVFLASIQVASAQVLSTPSITPPSAGSAFNKGVTFTLNATVSCSGASGKCNGVSMEAVLPSGLSTSSTNPQGCGSPNVGTSCTKTWTVSANSVGSYVINVSATSASAGNPSNTVSIAVNSVCGDGAIDGSEVCDGSNISSQTCITRGFDQGSLACLSDCSNYDTSGCSYFSCGNNVKEGSETCDGTDINNQTCVIFGFASGSLACAANCGSFNTSSCISKSPVANPGRIFGNIEIQITEPVSGQAFKNGDNMPVKVKLVDGATLVGGGLVKAKIGDKTETLVFDKFSKIYHGNIPIKDIQKGNRTLDILASHGDYIDAKKLVGFNVNPELNIVYQLEKEYIIGVEILIKGTITDFRNVYTTSNITISAELEKIKMFEKKMESNGTFEYRYKTTFFDPEGNWTFSVNSIDNFGNSGNLSKSVPVKIVSEGGFYSVKFLSPPPNSVFKRGEQVKITVAVEKDGNAAEGGNFSFRGPDGHIIFLKEVSAGIYSINYKLGLDSPEGNIPFYVLGFKEAENKTLSGAGKLPINVEKTGLVLEIISPTADGLIAGKPLDIIVKASYSDGSIPENLDIFTHSPAGEKITLTKKGENYVGSYKLKEGEEGVWKMELKASDPYQNTGSRLATLSVGKITPLYIILENLTSVAISVVIIAALLSVFAAFRHKKNYKKNLEKEINKITELKKEAQKKYFKENSISKETYQGLMEKYEEREAEIRKKIILNNKK